MGDTNNKKNNVLRKTLSKMSALLPKFKEVGLSLALSSFLVVEIGSSNGFSIGLVPTRQVEKVEEEAELVCTSEDRKLTEQDQADDSDDDKESDKGSSNLLVNVAKKAVEFASRLDSVGFQLVRVDVGLDGIGMGIPGASACLHLREQTAEEKQSGKDRRNKAKEAKKESVQEAAEAATKIAAAQPATKAVASRPGTSLPVATVAVSAPKSTPPSLSRPLRILSTLALEVASLRHIVKARGWKFGSMGGAGAFLSLTMGTVFGLAVKFVPLKSSSSSLSSTSSSLVNTNGTSKRLTVFQRLLLGLLSVAQAAAKKAGGTTGQIALAVSGVGLAIPALSARISILGGNKGEDDGYEKKEEAAEKVFLLEGDAVRKALDALDTEIEEEQEQEQEQEQEDDKEQEELEQKDVDVNWLEGLVEDEEDEEKGLEGGKQKTAAKVERNGVTRRLSSLFGSALQVGRSAVSHFAEVGSKAQKVMKNVKGRKSDLSSSSTSAALDFDGLVPRNENDHNQTLGMAERLAVVGRQQGLALQKPHWLDLTMGTSNGFRILFTKSEASQKTVEERSIGVEKQAGGVEKKMHKLLNKAIGSVAKAARPLKKANATLALLFVRVSGVGLGFPRACVGLVLDRNSLQGGDLENQKRAVGDLFEDADMLMGD